MSVIHAGCVIFDVDGTLIDTTEGIVGSFITALQENGYPSPDPGRIRRLIGRHLDDMFREISGTDEPARIEALVHSYRAHYRKDGIRRFSMFPGTIETLESLKRRGKTLAVASNKPTDFGMMVMERAGLLPFFGSLRFNTLQGFSLAYSKTDLIRQAMSDMGGIPSVMVGDSVVDIRSAKEAGIPVIACAFTTTPEEVLRAERPDAMVREFKAISELIE